jgi:hypothetical protein
VAAWHGEGEGGEARPTKSKAALKTVVKPEDLVDHVADDDHLKDSGRG